MREKKTKKNRENEELKRGKWKLSGREYEMREYKKGE